MEFYIVLFIHQVLKDIEMNTLIWRFFKIPFLLPHKSKSGQKDFKCFRYFCLWNHKSWIWIDSKQENVRFYGNTFNVVNTKRNIWLSEVNSRFWTLKFLAINNNCLLSFRQLLLPLHSLSLSLSLSQNVSN